MLHCLQTLVLCLLTYTLPILGAIHSRFEDLPDVLFDFIIVGGGTSGAVVANRLTENPKFNVLVIEAGPSNQGVLNSIVPAFAFGLANTQFDWNFTTTPQKGLNGRSVSFPRGHILGGSSSVNGMFYTRGSTDDYNRFATITGDSGWSWNSMLHYILKNEKWTTPADHHNTTGQFNPAFHRTEGMTFVSLPGFPQGNEDRIVQTTKDLPQDFPFNIDMNSGTPLGVGWLQSTIGNGMRSSAATSYLGPDFVKRSNLHILLQNRVTRLLQSSRDKHAKKPTFRSVELAANTAGPRTTITASKEVILAAGSIGTPQILMLSGIGDEAELLSVGVRPLVNLPGIGKNLTEHPLFTLLWSTTSPPTNTNQTAAFAEWNKTHAGPLTTLGLTHVAWSRISKDSGVFTKFSDPSAGPHSPHLEIALGGGGPLIAGGISLVTPTSRGSVTLKTNNPFDAPIIDPAYVESDFDILALREAVKNARKFFAGPAWEGFIVGPSGDFANATTDALLDEFIRNNVGPGAHPVGTAAMSPRGAQFGVVDPDLLVKQLSGLRIVDASVMPFVTCGHTQAPVYAIAERAADLIKGTWR